MVNIQKLLVIQGIFVEVTAIDETKANIALNTVVTMFSEYCGQPFSIEQVITESDGLEINYPFFENRDVVSDIQYLNTRIGIDIYPDNVVALLKRMGITAELSKDKKTVTAHISPTRTDIFHKCDLVEDVSIAYGFNNIPFRNPQTLCYGKQYQLNYISDKIRGEVARNGYTEILTFSLLSKEENYDKLNISRDSIPCVEIANPATAEFQVARTSLLPGILKTLSSNKDVSLPLKVFEVSDVVHLDDTSDTGAKNRRQLCAVYCNSVSQFEVIHSLLDKILKNFSLTFQDENRGYIIVPSENPTFLEGRRGNIIAIIKGIKTEIGTMGVLYPQVVLNFDLLCACSALILDVQFLVDN